MKKIFALFLCLSIMLLIACGTPSGDERGTTTHEESVTCAGTKTADVTEPNTLRLNGDYDSVPTVTVPERLSSEELDSIVIPVSADDPYSVIIANEIDWYKQASSGFNSEDERYFLYDINGDSVNELIIGHISALGGSAVYEYEGVSADFVYGILINEVYTIVDGKAIRSKGLLIGGDAYETILFNNGIIKALFQTPRNPQITYYKMVGDSFETVGGSLNRSFNGECSYFENGKEEKITEEEFNRRIAETEDGAHPVELEWKHLQDYGK